MNRCSALPPLPGDEFIDQLANRPSGVGAPPVHVRRTLVIAIYDDPRTPRRSVEEGRPLVRMLLDPVTLKVSTDQLPVELSGQLRNTMHWRDHGFRS